MEDDAGSAVAETVVKHVAVEGEVDVATAFRDAKDEAVYGGFQAVEHDHAAQGVEAGESGSGGEVDFAEAVVVNVQVDGVVVAAEPVEVVVVADDQTVADGLGDDIVDEVFRAGQLQMGQAAMYQVDVHVAEHA